MNPDTSGTRRRVLFVSSTSALYGAEYSLLHVVRRMDTTRWEPRFAVPGAGPFASLLRDSGYEVSELNVTSLRGRRHHEARTAFALAGLIRRSRAELVHLNLHFAWPAVSMACLMARVPLVVHVRNMIGPGRRGLVDQLLFRRITSIICISEAVRQGLLASGLWNPAAADRITVIPDGRDLVPFLYGNRSRLRAELGVPNGTPLIGMVARLEQMKGQDIFLRAARLVAEQHPDARFVLVGEVMNESGRSYRLELERLAAEPPLAGRVALLGYREDIPDILAALDCFVHSSRRGAFVSVLIEAMAAGVPIVATDVDGIPECVGRDGAAELVPAPDPDAFAAAILRVVTDPARGGSMGRLGRARAATRFDAVPLARATEAVFGPLVNGGGPHAR